MTALPPDWRLTRLDEVADTALGKMLDRGKTRGHREVPYLRNVNVQWGRIDLDDLLTMEIAEDELDRFAVARGDLLVCEGGEIGRNAIWQGRSEYLAYQKALHRIRPHAELEPRYLSHLLRRYADDGTLASVATGSTIAHLPQQRLRALPVPLPPLDEQRRIVAVLEDHLSRLDAADAYLAASLRRLRSAHGSTLARLVPDEVDYPPHWDATTTGGAGRVELGRQRHPDWHDGDNVRPYLRVANVYENDIRAHDLKSMHWPGDTFERFRLHPGDVLLNEGQTPELVGRPALYLGQPPDVAFTNSLLRFTAHDNVVPEFALLVFRRHVHTGRFTREARITTNIAHLSAARLKGVEFPIPPLEEQRALVNEATSVFQAHIRLREGLDLAVARGTALRRALLTAAFTGRLTGRSSDMDVAEELAEAAS
ncbi:restriction endonuclease subunit S [Pseudokineococcus sp. 5B2Z-1]|uniref:restriction endonuclease subunit S n=1 Tax=Pseudokineococcus sp. 5B2Z-1 TaxID=3132744 RepID=UPI0030A7EDCB